MLWTDDQSSPATSLVFVAKEQEDLAALYIATNAWPSVEHVAVVLPAGVQMLPLISAILSTDKFESACTARPLDVGSLVGALSSLDGAVREIAQISCELFLSLRRMDGAAAAYACTLLISDEKRLSVLPSATTSLLAKLARFIEEFGRGTIREWVLPALFIHPDNEDKRKCWWKDEPSIARSFKQSAERFNALVNGNVPVPVSEIRNWLLSLHAEAVKLYLSPGTTRSEADVFRTASSFMAVSADLHQNQDRYVLALLYLHRACEWLLAAECADLNLLDFSLRSGPRIKSSGKSLGFNDLLNELANAGNARVSGHYASFATLNTWRNLLACTHHMSAPSKVDASALFTSIRGILPNLGGAEWKKTFATLNTPFPLSLADFLDPFGDVRSTYSLKTAAEMRLLMN